MTLERRVSDVDATRDARWRCAFGAKVRCIEHRIEIVEIDERSRSRASVYVGLEKLNMRAVQSSLAVMTRA